MGCSNVAKEGWSNEVNERSGSCEERLITDAGREPSEESSLADGCEEEVSDEVVEVDIVGLCCGMSPRDVAGAELVRLSCRKLGVD